MDVDISLDKVSLVGTCADSYELQMWLDRVCRRPDTHVVMQPGKPNPMTGTLVHHQKPSVEARELPQMRGSKDGKAWVRRHWNIEGVDVQLRLKVPTEHRLSIERWDCMEGDDSSYRLEWNPNKAEAGSLVWMMQNPRATRYDVAVDYDGADLSDWTVTRPRTKSCTHVDASGNMNGVQLGGMKSDRFLVAYDKGVELGIEDLTMTRVEMRQRIRPDADPLHERLFQGVQMLKREIPSTVTPSQAGILALRLYEPAHFARLDADTRRKYDRLAESTCGQISPSPEQVYAERRSDLREWAEMVRTGERPPIARIYQRENPPEMRPPTGSATRDESDLSILPAN